VQGKIVLNSDYNYRKRLSDGASERFKAYWSGLRNWATFATVCLAPILLQILRHGFRSMVDLQETLVSGLVGLVLSLVGTCAITVWSTAKSMDQELSLKILDGETKIRELEQILAKPKRTASQEYYLQLAETVVKKHGSQGKKVLRHLHIHGSILVGFQPPPLPESMTLNETVSMLHALLEDDVVTKHMVPSLGGNGTKWEISPGMLEALDEILFR
jgi:hypothetical protein